MHHDVPRAPYSNSSHEMGSPMQGHVALHPGVADIGKFNYLKWSILGSIDVLSLPFTAGEMMRLVKLMWITSEARTSIKLEVSIAHQATVIE